MDFVFIWEKISYVDGAVFCLFKCLSIEEWKALRVINYEDGIKYKKQRLYIYIYCILKWNKKDGIYIYKRRYYLI